MRQAPTYFGEVAFTLEQPSADEAVLHLSTNFTKAPRQMVVHVPWFMALQSATADGKSLRALDGMLIVPAETREVRMRWAVKPDAPHMSYESAVAAYKAEYARRYAILMHGEEEK